MTARNRVAIVALMLAAYHAGSTRPVCANEGTIDHFANAVEVRRFSFETNEDQDYDGQPDDWTRRCGRGFPIYVKAGIDRQRGAAGKQSLRFDLNGGQAAYYSSLVRVNSSHSYILRANILTSGLEHDAAIVSVSFLDQRRQRISRMLSRPVAGTHKDWQTVWVGPFNPDPEVRFIVLGTHIVESDRRDVRGTVWFDDLWLGSLPQLDLSISSGRHYFSSGEQIFVEAKATGVATTGEHRLKLQLFGTEGQRLSETIIPLKVAAAAPAKPVPGLSPAPSIDPHGAIQKTSGHPDGSDGGADNALGNDGGVGGAFMTPHRWNLSQQGYGYFRVHATLERDHLPLLEKETSFVVVPAVEPLKQGEFGWSIPQQPSRLPLSTLGDVVSQGGVNWIKFPLWSACQLNVKNFDHAGMMQLLDRMEEQGISLVGLLNDPPAVLTDNCGQTCSGVSRIFRLPRSFWYSPLEPLIARYSFRIRNWQLGGEDDNSFIGLTSLPQVLQSVKAEFDRIGNDTRFGIHWDWNQPLPTPSDLDSPLPPSANTPTLAASEEAVTATTSRINTYGSARNRFLSLSSSNGTTAEELESALHKTKNAGIPRWVLIEALPTGRVSTEGRAADLVRKMLAAKLGGADAIFFNDPFSSQRGILHSDGSPAELFLPWRTTASLLRGATCLGSLDLPQRSLNTVIATPHELVVFAWNEQPTREEFYLGETLTATDLWGRPLAVDIDSKTGCRIVTVGKTPVILRGCSSPIARWLLSLRFEKGKLRSEYGGHEEAILGMNTFPQGVSAKVTLHMPNDWEVEPSNWTQQFAAGEKFRLPTLLTFPPDASLGRLRPTVDFEISADRQYKFTMHLPYELGLGDLNLRVTCRELPDGRLEVEQRIVNNTKPPEILDFNCTLFIPGQIRQKQVVNKLTPNSDGDKRLYFVPNAASLRGKQLWLRAEQIDGRRVLNYRLRVDE